MHLACEDVRTYTIHQLVWTSPPSNANKIEVFPDPVGPIIRFSAFGLKCKLPGTVRTNLRPEGVVVPLVWFDQVNDALWKPILSENCSLATEALWPLSKASSSSVWENPRVSKSSLVQINRTDLLQKLVDSVQRYFSSDTLSASKEGDLYLVPKGIEDDKRRECYRSAEFPFCNQSLQIGESLSAVVIEHYIH